MEVDKHFEIILPQIKPIDGFDTGICSHVTIKNTHVTSDDDCVSFKKGFEFNYS